MNFTNQSYYLEDNIFDDFNSTEYQNSFGTSVWSLSEIWFISMNILKFLISLAALAAALFLITIISKYERLKTKTNIFLLHYAIACALDNIMLPVVGIFITLIVETSPTRLQEIHCIGYQIGASTTLLIVLFAAAISVQWFLQNWKNKWLKKISNFEQYFAFSLYFLYFVKLIVYISDCFLPVIFFSKLLLLLCYLICFCIIIALNFFSSRQTLNVAQLNTKYQLTVSTYAILSYLPLVFIVLLIHFVENLNFSIFLYHLVYFAEFLAIGSCILVTYLLGVKNKYFKSVYSKVFKKSVREYNENDLDESSDDSENIQGNVENHVPSSAFVPDKYLST